VDAAVWLSYRPLTREQRPESADLLCGSGLHTSQGRTAARPAHVTEQINSLRNLFSFRWGRGAQSIYPRSLVPTRHRTFSEAGSRCREFQAGCSRLIGPSSKGY